VNLFRKLLGLDGPKPPAKAGRDRDFDLRGLERILHYNFKNPQLARQAMTHRSYLHATPGRSGESNERMEFLGDSVVGLVVNEFLYKKFTKLREGELTKMKSLLVSRVILSRAANQLGLGHYILLSDAEKGSGGRNRASILADTLEGVIGAMYLDGGIEPARRLSERLLLREVNSILSDANLANYKSMLQEYVQGEFKTHPQYRISSEYGPDHQKMFTVEVVVSGKTYGRGHGSNKKEAEQEAARDALFHFEKLAHPEPGKAKEGEKEEAGDPRRRRRRGGRGRRNGRGRTEGAPGEAVAGASQGRREGHRERHRSRDRDREGSRAEPGSEPRRGEGSREHEEREEPREHGAAREYDYEGPREYPPRERREHEGPREHEGGEREDHGSTRDDASSDTPRSSGEGSGQGHGATYAAARLRDR
jgi:ribonuclease III